MGFMVENKIYVDSATHNLIKVEAARRSITMGDLVSDMVGRYINEGDKQ